MATLVKDICRIYIDGVEYCPTHTETEENRNAYQDNPENSLLGNLKIISWNINGGFSTKITDKSFQRFISTYNIILLTECQLQKDYKDHIEDFDYHYFPREKSKTVQGGGTVI